MFGRDLTEKSESREPRCYITKLKGKLAHNCMIYYLLFHHPYHQLAENMQFRAVNNIVPGMYGYFMVYLADFLKSI